jgi:ABC-type bacteriocin/lantibiotic exporter with double-glycine peptidase domain
MPRNGGPSRQGGRPGGDRRHPRGLYGYIWQISGRAQILLALLSAALFLLDLAPLELQRRIVNDAIHQRAFDTLLWLCGAYCAVALLQGGTKLVLNIYRSSVGEAANRRLRIDTRQSALPNPRPDAAGKEGVGLSIILTEVEPVGGFIGTSVSEPVLHGGILLSVFSYLLVLQPWMAAVALALFVPQFVFVPLMQNAINQRTKWRIQTLRSLSVDLVNRTAEAAPQLEEDAYRDRVRDIYRLNMQIYRRKFSMNFLMNVLHHLGIVGILFIGGWLVMRGRTEIGTVVAFISGLNKINDPWGDLVNFFREMTNARVKYRLIAAALAGGDAADAVAHPPPPG